VIKLIILFQFIPWCLFAQNTLLNDYYSSPLAISLSLSGTFCEIRNNHFHAGIDLRTQGKEGFPVLAAANGFVSRIKVSSVGYGKALYITHPNGTVTVYGHLRAFADNIQHCVEEMQHTQQKFEVELFPDSNQFIVLKGEQIALSGNSGGSEAPHLHFEIRERYSEEPINPLLSGLMVYDTVFPVITHIAFYTNHSGSYERNRIERVKAINDSVYAVDDTVRLWNTNNKFYISFAAYDKAMALDSNAVGIYSATLINGFDTLFNYQYNRFNFSDTRYVNAHIDYEAKITEGIKLERCFSLPGDSFPAFKNSGSGIITFNEIAIANLKLVVQDFKRQSSTLLLELAKDSLIKKVKLIPKVTLVFNKEHILKSKNAALRIAKGNLYTTIDKEELMEWKGRNLYSPIVKVFNKTIPLHKGAEFAIRAIKIPVVLQSKALIATINDQNKITGSVGGVYKNGWIKTSIRSFGNYAVTVDTTPPTIFHNQVAFDSICNCNVVSFKIKDDLSGIENYKGFFDNEWALMEYDKKSDCLLYYFNNKITGPHQITIEATDAKGNTGYFKSCF